MSTFSITHPTAPSPSRVRHAAKFALCAVALTTTLGAAACSSDDTTGPRFIDPASATVPAGETLSSARWNHVTQTLIGRSVPLPSQNAAFRMMAYVTLSQHVAIEEVSIKPGVSRAEVRGSVAGASLPVLAYLFPKDVAVIDSIGLAEELSLPEAQRASFRAGVASGRTIGALVVARATADGFSTPWTGTVPTGPGKWSSLNVPPTPPLLPLLGQVKPFFMAKGDQFRPAPPPAFGSPAFLDALAEVRRISDTRTPTQDSIAKFWAVPTGGLIAGLWNRIGLEVITRNRLGERAAAHTLALMNTAMQEALIACHDAKYEWWYIRPSGADPAIKTSVGVPNHPSYPSNHSCLSSASANVLSGLFPAERERMQATANEAAMSRLYGGIHYRFDNDVGLDIGRKVAALALEVDRRGGLRRIVR